jgi:tRNA (guanine-N7-)-methyltransferase
LHAPPDGRHPRTIRSFVRRTGRMTTAQERALDELWPRFGVEYTPVLLDLDALFGRQAARVLEIGFGDGETLILQAAAHPELDFLGVEVHRPGVGHCLLRAAAADLSNLRLIAHDAVEVLGHQLPQQSIDRVNIYFPDPWPKKRHHKRRLLRPDFLALVAGTLKPGGALCIATDWANYAEHIDELLAAGSLFSLVERREHAGDRPLDRPVTRFERRGLAAGHTIVDWHLLRSAPDHA